MLKIWGRTNSVNVKKVLWCADELGIAYERRDAGMQYGVVNEPWYRRMNPNGLVPTIEDDGLVLWESNTIVIPSRARAIRHVSTIRTARQKSCCMPYISRPVLGLVRCYLKTNLEQRRRAEL